MILEEDILLSLSSFLHQGPSKISTVHFLITRKLLGMMHWSDNYTICRALVLIPPPLSEINEI